MSTQGPEETEVIQSSRFSDIRQALNRGQLTTDLVQAVNRVRTRRVVDGEGNCPFTNIFLWLPDGATGDAVYEGLRAELPNVFEFPWPHTPVASKRAVKLNF